jgi:hypothetical protein
MDVARRDRPVDRFLVHVCDHEHVAGPRIDRHGRHQSITVETRSENRALLDIAQVGGGHGLSGRRARAS